MTEIPQRVLSEAVADAIAGRRLLAAVFLTYELDPGFFEQEILPVLLDLPRGPTRGLKLAMLEDALARPERDIAVYYDRNGLRESDSGPAHLDVRRIPIALTTGIFHPKLVLALVETTQDPETEEQPEQALVVVAASANLTRSGWWQNVETSHIEEITASSRSRLRLGLDQPTGGSNLFDWLIRHSPEGTDHAALNKIRSFLKNVSTYDQRSHDGVAHPHFFIKGITSTRKNSEDATTPLIALLRDVFGRELDGMYLEVIAPYFDKAGDSKALLGLIEWFGPRQARVLLPRDNKGDAMLTPAMHAWLRALPNVEWGKLPKDLLRLGKKENAGTRFVHAKVYRFFQKRPRREIIVAGSINLTWPAHQPGGNVEAALIVETAPDADPDFWLAPEHTTPSTFVDPALPEDDAATNRGSPLMIRYHWGKDRADVCWGAEDVSPPLTLSIHGIRLVDLAPIAARVWTPLADDVTGQLRDRLRATSFVTVEHRGHRATVLVQEDGMAHKPSLVTDLSIEDILRYWVLLTPDQRAEFLEEHMPPLPGDDGADLMPSVPKPVPSPDRLFSRFAWTFQAFARLESEIVHALDEGCERDADYRLFGAKFDSLGPLLAQVKTDTTLDLVERYVITLCATQLRDQLKVRFPNYWRERAEEAKQLGASIDALSTIENDLVARNDGDMQRFIEWFRRRFLRRRDRADA